MKKIEHTQSFKDGIMRILKACGFSLDGFKAAFRDEAAFRQILILAVVGTPTAFCMTSVWHERMLLVLPLALCIIVELLNTAIENICDRITTEHDPFIKKAKDMGSAAQFSAQTYLVLTWVAWLVM